MDQIPPPTPEQHITAPTHTSRHPLFHKIKKITNEVYLCILGDNPRHLGIELSAVTESLQPADTVAQAFQHGLRWTREWVEELNGLGFGKVYATTDQVGKCVEL